VHRLSLHDGTAARVVKNKVNKEKMVSRPLPECTEGQHLYRRAGRVSFSGLLASSPLPTAANGEVVKKPIGNADFEHEGKVRAAPVNLGMKGCFCSAPQRSRRWA